MFVIKIDNVKIETAQTFGKARMIISSRDGVNRFHYFEPVWKGNQTVAHLANFNLTNDLRMCYLVYYVTSWYSRSGTTTFGDTIHLRIFSFSVRTNDSGYQSDLVNFRRYFHSVLEV